MVTNKKVVFITGGTRGIGKQTARIFAKAGYQLALNYHQNKKQAETFQEELMATYHVPVRLYQGNIGSEEEVKQMVQSIYEDFFKLDILILNAGPFIHENIKVKDYTTAQWRQMMTTNLDSFFYLIREILPHMEKQNWGRVVAFGYDQIERVSGWPKRGAYSAAKTGVAALVRTLAAEEKDYNITVNMICPGDIKADWKETDINTSRKKNIPNEKRNATGEDISRVVLFLSEENSDYLTGNIINLSGGENIIARKTKKNF